ncbi:MAG: hypothetical protein ACTHKX_09925 [Pseudolysinimonas sp.]
MTEPTTYARTDAGRVTPRWLTLVLASLATAIAIGALWSLSPSTAGCGDAVPVPGILPGPQPCGPDATVPALVTAGILLALLAAVFVIAFTVGRHRRLVLLILGGVMLLVLIIGLLVTVIVANTSPPVIYY